ncbi:PAS domain-containing protein, partial [Chloroflexota bacterium]
MGDKVKDKDITIGELSEELALLNRRIVELEEREAGRKRMEGELLHRIEFEELIAGISTQFINIPLEDMDGAIDRALKAIREFAEVDVAYIAQLGESGTELVNISLWCAEGIDFTIDKKRPFPVQIEPWFIEKMSRLENVHISRMADLPPGASFSRGFMRRLGLRSCLIVPMACGGALLGLVGLDTVRAEGIWSDDDVRLIRAVGNVFASAMERKRIEGELTRLSNALRMSNDAIAITDCNGTITWASEAVVRTYGIADKNDLVGKTPLDFAPAEGDENIARMLREMTRNGRVQEWEYSGHIAGGGIKPIELSISPMKGSDGNH